MDEAILLPSPNWFLVSGMAVTKDGWLIYGGPSKSLCILEPLAPERSILVSENGYRTHFFARVHSEKITAIDICLEWPEKKCFITGAADGSVKLWNMENIDNTINIKYIYNHSMHSSEREDVVGVGYSTNNFAVTVGSYGRIVKWDLLSNIVKAYNLILSKFKPTCIACSPHVSLQIAVGTKQGVVLVMDLSDTGTTLFKVRSHDDEVLCVSWCPQFNVFMKRILREFEVKNSANKRMEKIRQDAYKDQNEQLDDSALTKTLPEDSFDETVVEEEDFFDVYKDHEEEEFGHKKYIPEVIVVKEEEPKSADFDYLAECQKLKDKILNTKEKPDPSINSLVDAFDKTHVIDDNANSLGDSKPKKKENNSAKIIESSKQSQKHLLATIGKQGQLRVWSRTGKLLGNALIPNKVNTSNKHPNQKVNQPPWGTLLWYKPDVLLITDARGQLLECNPLITDCRNKLDTGVVDVIHKRGTFCIVSNAPRSQKQNENVSQDNGQSQDNKAIKKVLPEDQWCVWTAAQDRSIVCYSMTKRRKMWTYNSCGGYVYNIQTCPYDAKKMAMCVGDGAIRIWEMDIAEDNDEKLIRGHVTSFWQNVQGKVLVVAWHPTRENLVAFGTAEARVGILDITSNQERPARVLNIGVSGSVYSLCWGEHNDLYVCGGGDMVMYTLKKEADPKTIPVELDGDKWRLSAVSWYPYGLMCGSTNGSVALLSNTTYEVLAISFLFKKLINSIEWHPHFTSSSSEESSLKNLVAVCSMDRCFKIAIMKHSQNEDGKHLLEIYKYLEGHKGNVMQLAWNPHQEGRLASTSADGTVRVWDVEPGTCMAIYPANSFSPISLAWSAFPQHANVLVTGGSDNSVRIWKLEDYPPEAYIENLPTSLLPKKERKRRSRAERMGERGEVNEGAAEEAVSAESLYGEGREADQMAFRLKAYKKFLLPICSKQISNSTAITARKLVEKFFAEDGDKTGDEDPAMNYDTDFLKMFGTTNELNELLDLEMAYHLEAKDTDAWIMLAIFRGQIDTMIQFASKNDLLCPFLVSLSPCVSFKYWKDVTQLYLGQINRFMVQKREHKLTQSRSYGGGVFRKAALMLSVHDVKSAVDCLVEARMFRDAYVLCRARHMESIARETLWLWLKDAIANGYLKMAIICYIALGEFHKASTAIAGVTEDDENWLSLAADLAKMAGQHTFADHLEDKKEQIKRPTNNQEVDDALEQLPTRMQLLLKANCSEDDDFEAGSDKENDLKSANGVTFKDDEIDTKE